MLPVLRPFRLPYGFITAVRTVVCILKRIDVEIYLYGFIAFVLQYAVFPHVQVQAHLVTVESVFQFYDYFPYV